MIAPKIAAVSSSQAFARAVDQSMFCWTRVNHRPLDCGECREEQIGNDRTYTAAERVHEAPAVEQASSSAVSSIYACASSSMILKFDSYAAYFAFDLRIASSF